MTLRVQLVLCALLATTGAVAEEVCARDTGGSCAVFGCRGWRDASCENSKCVCPPGKCAYGGKCMESAGCFQQTFGTCSIFSCAAKRGDTVCADGHCNCAPGACSYAGVCYDKCPKDTGGTCRIYECDSYRNSQCSGWDGGYKCVCPEGYCSVNGVCLSGKATTTKPTMMLAANASLAQSPQEALGPVPEGLDAILDVLPDYDDPVLLTLVASAAVPSAVIAGMLFFVRRRRSGIMSTPLLSDETHPESKTIHNEVVA